MVQCAVPVYSVRQENKSEFIYERNKKLIFELICMTNAENEKKKCHSRVHIIKKHSGMEHCEGM